MRVPTQFDIKNVESKCIRDGNAQVLENPFFWCGCCVRVPIKVLRLGFGVLLIGGSSLDIVDERRVRRGMVYMAAVLYRLRIQNLWSGVNMIPNRNLWNMGPHLS